MSTAATANTPPRYQVDAIPPELKALDRWVVFQCVRQPNGKLKKIPLIAGTTGVRKAESNNPATWRSFDVAVRDAEMRHLYLGFVFGREIDRFLIDADDVIDAHGAIRPDILEVCTFLQTYTEFSAGGKGLHIIGRGSFPERCEKTIPNLELFPLRGPRMCVLTGETIPGLETMEDRGAEIAALFPPRPAGHANGSTSGAGYAGASGVLTDEELDAIVTWASSHWTEGLRHFTALYLAGYLGKSGVSHEQATIIIERCAADDPDPRNARTACDNSYTKLQSTGDVAGWSGLKDVCGISEQDLARLANVVDGYRKRIAAEAARDAPWDEPVPLPQHEQPPFPTHLLPAPLAPFIQELATFTQTPSALPALMTIGVTSTALAKRVEVEVRPGWREPTNSYMLVALDSGNRKSAVAQAVGAPLLADQKERALALAPDIARARAKRDVVEKRLERLKKEQARNPIDDLALEADIRATVEELMSDALRVPVAPQYLVDDVTPERLADLLGEHGERMGVLSAEGGIFQVIAGRYSEGRADGLDLFLKGHSGDYLPIDRVGRPTKHLEAPALTLALAPQPVVLAGLTRFPGFRGRGLLARFAYGVPVSTVGRRRVAAPPVADKVKTDYERLVASLLALPRPDANVPGNSVDSVYECQPITLTFSAEAAETFMAFERWLEPQLAREVGALGDIADWGSKLAGLVARWAGIFHAIEHVRPRNGGQSSVLDSCQIAEETIARVVAVAKTFLIPHARTAFAMMGADRSESRAHRVLGVVRTWPAEMITRRDIHQHTRRSIPEVTDLDRPLALLEEHGYLRRSPMETTRPGRKPSPAFLINPLGRTTNEAASGRQEEFHVDTSNERAPPPNTYTESTEFKSTGSFRNSVDSVYEFQGGHPSSEGSQGAPSEAGDWTHRSARTLESNGWDAAPEAEEWTLPDPSDVMTATPPVDTPAMWDDTNQDEPAIAGVLAQLVEFTPQEIEQFRQGVAAASDDDPFAAVDHEALSRFDRQSSRSTEMSA